MMINILLITAGTVIAALSLVAGYYLNLLRLQNKKRARDQDALNEIASKKHQ